MDDIQAFDPNLPSREARMWAMWCHLGALSGFLIPIPFANIIVPAAIWMAKSGKEPFVDEHGRESLNFQITLTIYAIISAILILVLIGIALLIAVYVLGLVFVIIAAVRANDGEHYRYPLTLRLL